jgi:hypothetical protein
MQVFDNQENRFMFSKFQEDGDYGFQRFLSLALWGQIEWSIPRLG